MSSQADALDSTIDALVNIGDAEEMQAILRQAPHLLSDQGLERIAQRAAEAQAKGQRSLFQMLEVLRSVAAQVMLDVARCSPSDLCGSLLWTTTKQLCGVLQKTILQHRICVLTSCIIQ